MRKNLSDDVMNLRVSNFDEMSSWRVSATRCFIFAWLYLSVTSHVVAGNYATKGYEVYTNNCTVCHGEDGEGLMPGVPDLNISRDWFSQTDEKLIEKIKRGTQQSDILIAMPPKGGNPNLTDDDILDVIVYMRKAFKD